MRAYGKEGGIGPPQQHACFAISATRSTEVSLSIMTSAKPFGIDMDFTTTVGYSYSQTSEESTTLKYDFDLVRSDPGYIVMVNAQVSARVRYSVRLNAMKP
ncbi:hypothetical protein BGZ59_003614 [Podila verticillata]|nr:hypothetical protein BGZ59_003614 [Podila verticillata]